MAYEQHNQGSMAQFESDGEILLKQKLKSLPAATDSEHTNGCFDCNICLDSAHDPVVTLCGHLYCWPCIYKWLNVERLETSSFEQEEKENPKCPVCKAKISETSLVPLYGRGSSTSESDTKKPQLNLIIPPRPNFTANPNQPIRSCPFQLQHQPLHHPQYLPPNPYANYGPMASPNNFSPTTVRMVGEMVFTRMFGNTDMGLYPYPYSSAAPLVGNGSPRMRRQAMEVEKSLNRVTIFLFCCFVLCLLSF